MATRVASRRLASLRHRGFRLLAGGQLASNLGDAFYAVALPWYVLASHGGAALLGTVLAAYGIPRTVLLAVGGHASDRWRPWTVMMASDAVRVLAAAALAAAASLGPPRAAVLVPIAAILGAGEGMFLPGSYAIIPALLPPEDLQAGNALAASGTQLATLAGPAIGGALVALLGSSPAFALDAVSFAISAATLAGIRAAVRPAAGTQARPAINPRETAAKHQPSVVLGDEPVTVGPTLRTLLRSERILQISLVVNIAANLGLGGAAEVALPSLARGPLHAGSIGYGGLLAALAVGGLLGTLAASQLRNARRPLMTGSFAFLAGAVAIAVTPYAGGTIAVGAALVAFGVLEGFANVVTITAFQQWAPPTALGRLIGVLMLTSYGVFPVSVALGALVVRDLGPAPFFPLAGACLAIAILVALSQRTWREFGTARATASGQPPPGNAGPDLAQAVAEGDEAG
jgi:predicted MFS family arabinose efflux permease